MKIFQCMNTFLPSPGLGKSRGRNDAKRGVFIRYPETSRCTGLKKHFIPVIQHFVFMSLIGRSTDLSGRHARPTRLLSLAGVLSFSKAMSLLMPNGFF